MQRLSLREPHGLGVIAISIIAISIVTSGLATAQGTTGMDHASHLGGTPPTANAPAGQAAYEALAAAVAALEADPTTDWSKVNIEALRQHLIAMNEVTLYSRSAQTSIPGGAQMDVTGDGHVAESIRAMWHMHAVMLDELGPFRATVVDIPGGARVTVTAAKALDEQTAVKIRALGASGLLTLGAHHARHHMALARGEAMTH